jgi:hypothetical protein
VYRRDPKNAELCERLVDLDEGVQEWRGYRATRRWSSGRFGTKNRERADRRGAA